MSFTILNFTKQLWSNPTKHNSSTPLRHTGGTVAFVSNFSIRCPQQEKSLALTM
jgi:hypothetical protein